MWILLFWATLFCVDLIKVWEQCLYWLGIMSTVEACQRSTDKFEYTHATQRCIKTWKIKTFQQFLNFSATNIWCRNKSSMLWIWISLLLPESIIQVIQNHLISFSKGSHNTCASTLSQISMLVMCHHRDADFQSKFVKFVKISKINKNCGHLQMCATVSKTQFEL